MDSLDVNDLRSTGQTQRLTGDAAGISRAADLLRAGKLVAFPTETVYGLGADATDGAAVAGIYAAKERPRFNPLIAHVPTLDAVRRLGVLDANAERLAAAFWPGPLTLVVPRTATCDVADLALAGHDSVAVRVPAHPLAQALLRAVARPVVAPSANRSGRISPTRAEHVIGDLDGRIDAVVDGGPCEVGVESTIVACLPGGPVLLRPGGVARDAIERLIGSLGDTTDAGAAPLAPGMLASHYAPRALVRRGAHEIRKGEAALLFGRDPIKGAAMAAASFNLSAAGDLREAAARLFEGLRALDTSGADTIAAAPIPMEGLGEAINDRLARAAAERD